MLRFQGGFRMMFREGRDRLDEVAALFHEAWMHWSMRVAREEDISSERREQWLYQWVPYDELSDAEREKYRAYARHALERIE